MDPAPNLTSSGSSLTCDIDKGVDDFLTVYGPKLESQLANSKLGKNRPLKSLYTLGIKTQCPQ